MSTIIDLVVTNIKNIFNPTEITQETLDAQQLPQLTDLEILQQKMIKEEAKQDELVKQILHTEMIREENIIKEEKLKILQETNEFENIDDFNFNNKNRPTYFNEFFGNINNNNNNNYYNYNNNMNIKSKEIFLLIILVLIFYLIFIKD
jgi:hypothetical protein